MNSVMLINISSGVLPHVNLRATRRIFALTCTLIFSSFSTAKSSDLIVIESPAIISIALTAAYNFKAEFQPNGLIMDTFKINCPLAGQSVVEPCFATVSFNIISTLKRTLTKSEAGTCRESTSSRAIEVNVYADGSARVGGIGGCSGSRTYNYTEEQ